MNQEIELARCAVCNQQTPRRCSRCLSIYYCNQDHQRQDWRRHKTECLPKLTKQSSKPERSIEQPSKSTVISKIEEKCDNNSLKSTSASENIPIKQEGSVTNQRRTIKSRKKNTSKLEGSASVSDDKFNSKTTPDGISTKNHSVNTKVDSNSSLSKDNVPSSIVCSNKELDRQSAITQQGSSEQKILSEPTQQLSPVNFSMGSTTHVLNTASRMPMPILPGYGHDQPKPKEYSDTARNNNVMGQINCIDPSDPDFEVCRTLIRDMNQYGVCLLKNFYGKERGTRVLNEVLGMYKSGIFTAGELVSSPDSTKSQAIRSDLTTWIAGTETGCTNIGQLMSYIDKIIINANKMPNNGKMGDYVIRGRTKAMLACYPGSGTHYVQHIDNPHGDGRCITAIYYLNVDWDVERSGGLLRVFPEGIDEVCNVEPIFDQMLFFWSDRRNPHEVQPAFDTRYAITLWYFDQKERAEALKRYRERAQASSSK